MARELGVLKVGCVSVDGSHIRANASKDKNVTYDRAGELIEQLKLDIAELLKKAETADQADPAGEELPQELARRETLKAKLEEARSKAESRARAGG